MLNSNPGCLPRKVLKTVCENYIDRKEQRFDLKEGLVFQQQANI